MTTRYIGNDSNLNVENCLLDIGATVRYLREHGYKRVVLAGNSGGGTVVPYYQAQAEHPSVTTPPGGGPDLAAAGLPPADALILFMAHPSRARLSMEWLDPGHHRRVRALRARCGPRRLQPAERAALQRRVHRAVPRRPARQEPADHQPGRSCSWPGSQTTATGRTGSMISPSWCMARRRTCGSSIRPSTRATGPPGAPCGARRRWPTTSRPGSAGTRRCAPGSTSGR